MEVTIGDRRLKMIDGEIFLRAIFRGKETKKEIWKRIKFGINTGYDRCDICINGTTRGIYKHRLVYKVHNPDWDIEYSSTNNQIDHINGNRHDNRIENLRLVTNHQNQHNRTKAKGYSIITRTGKYGAKIGLNNKTIHIGTYKTEDEAHQAYLEAKKKYHVIDSPRTLD